MKLSEKSKKRLLMWALVGSTIFCVTSVYNCTKKVVKYKKRLDAIVKPEDMITVDFEYPEKEGYVDKDGVYGGAGYLDVQFFKAYTEGVTVGTMLTQAQNDYINYVGKDFFTIEEFILLGDPSLKVGGVP